jgi:hypothetical protein
VFCSFNPPDLRNLLNPCVRLYRLSKGAESRSNVSTCEKDIANTALREGGEITYPNKCSGASTCLTGRKASRCSGFRKWLAHCLSCYFYSAHETYVSVESRPHYDETRVRVSNTRPLKRGPESSLRALRHSIAVCIGRVYLRLRRSRKRSLCTSCGGHKSHLVDSPSLGSTLQSDHGNDNEPWK